LNVKIAGFEFSQNDHRSISIRKGTSFYRAPEIMREKFPYDGEKADVFALGCSLYTILMASYPFFTFNEYEDDLDVTQLKMY
jgi:serine/threonine protein kinase